VQLCCGCPVSMVHGGAPAGLPRGSGSVALAGGSEPPSGFALSPSGDVIFVGVERGCGGLVGGRERDVGGTAASILFAFLASCEIPAAQVGRW
jgi:hypothetical protein